MPFVSISFSFSCLLSPLLRFFFFFNDTATTEIYTLSLHDALPISYNQLGYAYRFLENYAKAEETFKKYIQVIPDDPNPYEDRKSTRLNSSHSQISYAVFCLKKKKKNIILRVRVRKRIQDDTRLLVG